MGHGTGSYFKNGGGRSTTTILHPILAALCSLLLLFFLFPGLLFLEMLVGFQSSLTSPRRKISLHRLISYITYEYSTYPSCIGLLLRNTRKGGPQSASFFSCDAATLYERVSVRWLVGPSVGPSVTLSFFGLLGATNAVYTAPLLVSSWRR